MYLIKKNTIKKDPIFTTNQQNMYRLAPKMPFIISATVLGAFHLVPALVVSFERVANFFAQSFSSIVSETTFGGVVVLARHELPSEPQKHAAVGVVVLARHELPSEPQKHAVLAFSSIVPETTFGGVVALARHELPSEPQKHAVGVVVLARHELPSEPQKHAVVVRAGTNRVPTAGARAP